MPLPRKLLATFASTVVVVGLGAVIAAQGNNGHVFVSTSGGVVPDGNLFQTAQSPYLNSGPRGNAKCSKGNLADGDYYFQVTDPSGRVLLSPDSIDNRRFTASGGKIVSASASHASAVGRCSDVLVQLFPFETTANREGDYKVWVVAVNQYAPGAGSFGFQPKSSVTHNFKLVPPAAPATEVDSDGDGIADFYDHCPLFFDPANTCYAG
jgi:hypothetical protein